MMTFTEAWHELLEGPVVKLKDGTTITQKKGGFVLRKGGKWGDIFYKDEADFKDNAPEFYKAWKMGQAKLVGVHRKQKRRPVRLQKK